MQKAVKPVWAELASTTKALEFAEKLSEMGK
jgi:hypothetical protein